MPPRLKHASRGRGVFAQTSGDTGTGRTGTDNDVIETGG